MKKSLNFILCIMFFIFPVYALKAQEKNHFDIKYQIYHDVSDFDHPKLKISCTINTQILNVEKSKKKHFYLQLPGKWSEAKNLENYISKLHPLGKDVQVDETKNKNLKKITINPFSSFVTLVYEVYPKSELNLLEPIINKDIFHFIGQTLFIYPNIDMDKNLRIQLETSSSIKNNVIIANSFGYDSAQNLNLSLNAFRDAAFAGGLYQKDIIELDNTHILSYGLKKETKKYIVELLNKIIPVHKSFWNESKEKNNLVFLHANDFAQTTMSGTRTTGAFSVLLNETSPFLHEDLPIFLSHEHWHTWMGGEYFSAYSYKHMAWLFEGITDYYAHKAAYQAGILDEASWVKKYNRILSKHYLSSVKNKTNQDIIKYFDEDLNYSDLPYTRGKIIALELDNRIQLLSKGKYSLDDVIKEVCSENKNHAITMKDFKDALQKFYPEAKNFVKLYIEKGNDLTLSLSIFNNASRLHFVKMKPENYGFDIKSTFINQVVSGLSNKSDAYKNGLRNGQKVISHKVNYDDINTPILLKVISINNTEETFLLERIEKAISVPQYF